MSRSRLGPDGTPLDGRAARAQRTREAVADALLNLIEEGQLRPTSCRIAERAGVSERTIFQHFADLETLFRVASERIGLRIMSQVHRIDESASFDDRLDDWVTQHAFVQESISPVRRASALHEPSSPTIREKLDDMRQARHSSIDRVFRGELDSLPAAIRDAAHASLMIATGWTAWESLRRHQGLEVDEAREVVRYMIRTLLGQA